MSGTVIQPSTGLVGASAGGPAPDGKLVEAPAAAVEATSLVPAERAVRLRAVPFEIVGKRLRVAMADISDDAAADEISTLARRPIERVAITEEAYEELARLAYGTVEPALE